MKLGQLPSSNKGWLILKRNLTFKTMVNSLHLLSIICKHVHVARICAWMSSVSWRIATLVMCSILTFKLIFFSWTWNPFSVVNITCANGDQCMLHLGSAWMNNKNTERFYLWINFFPIFTCCLKIQHKEIVKLLRFPHFTRSLQVLLLLLLLSDTRIEVLKCLLASSTCQKFGFSSKHCNLNSKQAISFTALTCS